MSDKPAHKVRIGLITATIWKNEPENGTPFYTVQLQRTYKNGAGEWKSSDTLNHDDLLNASKVLQRAEGWIAAQ
ncbi:hypothetical protein ACRDNQ_03905 [Palleronia sp. KMU-117]|uniref:hypothetical protein n=1 Tax=Palleronia sp. KMU-117 TaxID=3434108 RepID=UPI003D704093